MEPRQPPRRDDSRLGAASAEGSFEEIALCHLDVVYRVAQKLCGNAHEAEDLAQETFLRAQASFDRFKLHEFGAKPWLLRILYNVFYNRAGQNQRATTLVADLSLDDFAAALSHEEIPSLSTGQMDWDNFDDELKLAVESLAPEYRWVILLWALGDLSYKEIAHILGCAMGTVMSRLHRARQQLSEVLAEYAARRGIRPRPSIQP